MTATAYAWAPITKAEEQPDGTLMVYGPAADAGVDRDRQRCSQAWLDKAMPAWMAEGGNVREQHDPRRAVGVGVGLTKADDGTYLLAAHVVDPVAVTKVTAKVLKGFSVGIKDPRVDFGKADAPGGEIVDGSICEVSLCDRPSNPRTLFAIAKADGADLAVVAEPEVLAWAGDLEKFVSAAQRDKDAASGIAMPNGDFPIPDAGHLQAAIGRLANYTGDKAAARKHIIKRARALGLTSKLPDDWNVGKADQVLTNVAALLPDLAKADADADIASAMEAVACIGRLIQSEAGSLAAGNLDEAYDISYLLDAVRALRYFMAREQAEPDSDTGGGTGADDSISGGIFMADKPTETAPAAGATKTDAPDAAKTVTAADLPDIVKAAVTEATRPLQDELGLVKADLAKVLALPEPGGPVLKRTPGEAGLARTHDATQLRARADALLTKADATSDHTLAQGYREMAADLRRQADA